MKIGPTKHTLGFANRVGPLRVLPSGLRHTARTPRNYVRGEESHNHPHFLRLPSPFPLTFSLSDSSSFLNPFSVPPINDAMQEADQHDLSDDSDYAASQQQVTLIRTPSPKSILYGYQFIGAILPFVLSWLVDQINKNFVLLSMFQFGAVVDSFLVTCCWNWRSRWFGLDLFLFFVF